MVKALIAGGGIAGPVTAMALRRAGVEAVVYEAHVPGTGDVVAEGDAGDRPGLTHPRLGVHLLGVPEGKDQAVVGLDEHHIAGVFAADGPAEALHVEAAGGINAADA